MSKKLSYAEVQSIILEHCHDVAHLFADGWSRFPQGYAAVECVNALNDKCEEYYAMGEKIPKYKEYAELCADAAAEIITRENVR